MYKSNLSEKEQLENITREFSKLLDFLIEKYPLVYEEWKSGLKPAFQ